MCGWVLLGGGRIFECPVWKRVVVTIGRDSCLVGGSVQRGLTGETVLVN